MNAQSVRTYGAVENSLLRDRLDVAFDLYRTPVQIFERHACGGQCERKTRM
ncbi:hypothetical protein [Scytonema sp. PCC 10023]|uniref:hypothetical protein n=1 Tax=Scytonema sp. PCC 10023 TaxID=1680591 RepID=UPI0039C5D74C